jgi:uncharacterized protein
MQTIIIGREDEREIMGKLLKSTAPELLAMYGRRRVGKTFLIKHFYAPNMIFLFSGQLKGTKDDQLHNFAEQLNKWFPAEKSWRKPKGWPQAFTQLQACVEKTRGNKKKVLFFDELPWLDNHKSGFLSAFDYFWNNFASTRNDLLVTVCGSAASWIIDKIINNKGGLHNRVTQRIRLLPFTLQETKAYLAHKKIMYSHYQMLQLYMVFGGVPHYLNAVERSKSVQQNIEQLCFTKDGLLTGEFENLYASLFSNYSKHIQVAKTLALKSDGLTRSEIIAAGKLQTGGGTSAVLSELVESGFAEKIFPFNKKEKDSLYRLTDEFSLFYFRFMQKEKGNEKGQWLAKSTTPAYTSWCGYAFESICLKHIVQIKKGLQIAGMQSSQSSWYKAGSQQNEGAQIDLLIDRADQCINICEIKFSTTPFIIDKKYAGSLEKRLMLFRQQTATRKNLMLTFITTHGIADNAYKTQLVDNSLTMDALFT